MPRNPVKETSYWVVQRAQNVHINRLKLGEFVEKLAKKSLTIPAWPKSKHFFNPLNPNQTLTYLFLLDTLNFCFWQKKENLEWQYIYQQRKVRGYFALAIALKNFFKQQPEKANFSYFSQISYKEFSSIFQGKGELLLLKQRWLITRKVSQFFIKKYQGSVVKFVQEANHSAQKLVTKIYQEIPFFNDMAYYQNKKIFFLKRAQILIADLAGAFNYQDLGYFQDLDYLSAFADYKLPQILYHLGIFNYSPRLFRKIKERKLIPHNSRFEIEIRASTVVAVELIKDLLAQYHQSFYSFQIDWFLWNLAQRQKMILPHHLTLTIFY